MAIELDQPLARAIFSLIDLTSLNTSDNADTIAALCAKANRHAQHVAAVCVYPAFVPLAAQLLAKTPVKIATVVNFPAGTDSLASVITTVKHAIIAGADEIDLVLPYQAYLAGETRGVTEFINACKTAAPAQLLKVILETGALPNDATITAMSELAMTAGADFLKTSTGKIAQGATLNAAACMLDVIKKSTKPVGLKVSGGIKTPQQAFDYMQLVESTMGSKWLTSDHFRIGASQLVDSLLNKI